MLDSIYLVALFATLWATGIGLGMAHAPGTVLAALRPPDRLARLILLNALVTPLVVWGLTRVAGVPPGFAAGLLLVGAASAGPLGLKLAHVGRGDLPFAIALVVVLEALNVVAIPTWVAILGPGEVAVPLREIVLTLGLAVLLPLAVGFAVASLAPAARSCAQPVVDQASTVGLAAVVVIVLIRDAGVLGEAMRSGVAAVAAGTVAFGSVAGWLAAGGRAPARRSGALVTAFRANGPALAAAAAMGGATSPATTAIVAFALVGLLVAVPLSVALSRSTTRSADARGRSMAPETVDPREPALPG